MARCGGVRLSGGRAGAAGAAGGGRARTAGAAGSLAGGAERSRQYAREASRGGHGRSRWPEVRKRADWAAEDGSSTPAAVKIGLS